MIEWLYQATIEFTLVTCLILLISPVIRRLLGAQVAYGLWALPVLNLLIWKKPERPQSVLEVIGMPEGGVSLQMSSPDSVLMLSQSWHVEWIWAAGALAWIAIRTYEGKQMRAALMTCSTPLVLPDTLFDSLPKPLQSGKVDFYTTSFPGAPFVTGLSHVGIFLPEDFFKRYTPEEQKWVLVHELTHVRRKDLWGQLLAEGVRACFWFNPLVHYSFSNFREDQELACDYQALKDCNSRERLQYGQAMLQGMSANLLPAALAFFTLKKERFIMLQKHKKSKLRDFAGASLGLVLGALILTKAPNSLAIESLEGTGGLSFEFVNIPIVEFSNLLSSSMAKELVGKEMLEADGSVMTMELNDVPARETLRFILSCRGFDYVEKESTIELYKTESLPQDVKTCEQLIVGNIEEVLIQVSEEKKDPHSVIASDLIRIINNNNSDAMHKFFADRFNMEEFTRWNLDALALEFSKVHGLYPELSEHAKVIELTMGNNVSRVEVASWSESQNRDFHFVYYIDSSKPEKILDIEFGIKNK